MNETTRIWYGLVGRGKTVLYDCELIPCDKGLLPDGYESLCQSALDCVDSPRSQWESQREDTVNYKSIKLSVCVYSSGGFCYICVTSMVFQLDFAFACLRMVEEQFQGKDGGRMARTSNFSPSLRFILSSYSSHGFLAKVEGRRGQVRDVERNCFHAEIKGRRGNSWDDLRIRTELLKQDSDKMDFIHRKKDSVVQSKNHCVIL